MVEMLSKSGLMASVVLAVAVPAAAQDRGTLMTPAIQGTRLDIVASGDVDAVPDLATIGAGVVTQAPTAALAMSENARRSAATVAAIRKAGVADRDIQTTSVSLSPQYRYAENQPPVITGYQASSRVSVRFRDIKAAGPILDSLVTAGANQIDGPVLTIDKPDPLLDRAREKAIATARARAELYARATGLKVRRIVAINEGSYSMPSPPMPLLMMQRKEAASADTSIEAGEQRLSISVSVTFELD